MNSEQQKREDIIVLYQLLTEIVLLTRFCKTQHFVTTDRLTKGLGEMTKTLHIPIWLSMAATCFLDIHHILRNRVGESFAKIQEFHGHVAEILNEHIDLSNNIKDQSNLMG